MKAKEFWRIGDQARSFVFQDSTWRVIRILERYRKEKGHMKIRPLGDKVLVERVEAEAKTAGGIVLPDTAKEKPQRGKIVSVGEG